MIFTPDVDVSSQRGAAKGNLLAPRVSAADTTLPTSYGSTAAAVFEGSSMRR